MTAGSMYEGEVPESMTLSSMCRGGEVLEGMTTGSTWRREVTEGMTVNRMSSRGVLEGMSADSGLHSQSGIYYFKIHGKIPLSDLAYFTFFFFKFTKKRYQNAA